MYYYIFEPPKEAREYERIAQIKELLSSLGIAGEMNTPAPGKPVAEIVGMAVQKRYSTIIAVGGIGLINQTARALEPYDAVFGIIPLAEHQDIERLIGTSDWKQAAQHLKRRRWQPVRLGLVNQSFCFLTPATLRLPDQEPFTLSAASFSLSGLGGSFTVTPVAGDHEQQADPCLQVEVESGRPSRGNWLSGLFGKQSAAPTGSRFCLPEFGIECPRPVDVSVAGTVLTQTPALFSTQAKALRLIAAKGGLANDS